MRNTNCSMNKGLRWFASGMLLVLEAWQEVGRSFGDNGEHFTLPPDLLSKIFNRMTCFTLLRYTRTRFLLSDISIPLAPKVSLLPLVFTSQCSELQYLNGELSQPLKPCETSHCIALKLLSISHSIVPCLKKPCADKRPPIALLIFSLLMWLNTEITRKELPTPSIEEYFCVCQSRSPCWLQSVSTLAGQI